jgi:predicted Zn-dependent peptidase
MIRHDFTQIGETMWEEKLENGLGVFVFPKPEFGKSFAFFATNYGGMDTRFQPAGQNAWEDTPGGVAHFLEHKMFDMPGGNALQTLSARGASPNAFTGSAITGYHFECGEGFYENLEILLSFVSTPYFTPESVDKEQGIIGQEIQMIEDNPSWRLYQNLTRALYTHSPVRNSVAGTRESIAAITADTLRHCHAAFYQPANMVLCVAGDVDAEKICGLARTILPKTNAGQPKRDYGAAEPAAAHKTELSLPMEVAASLWQLGVKLPPAPAGEARLRQQFVAELLMETWMGTSSPLYADLYQKGLVNEQFYCGYQSYPGCAFLLAGGEGKNPCLTRDALWAEGERLRKEGIDEELFQRLKKAAYGSQIRATNSFEHLCVEQARAYFAGETFWLFPEIYASIQKTDLEAALGDWLRTERAALSVVCPKDETP